MSAPATPSGTHSHSGTPTDPNKRRKIVSCLDCHSRKVKVSNILQILPSTAHSAPNASQRRANSPFSPFCSAPRTAPCAPSVSSVASRLLAPMRFPRTSSTRSIMLSWPPLLLPNVKPSRPSQSALKLQQTSAITDYDTTTESRLRPSPLRPSCPLRRPLQSLCQSLGARTTCSSETTTCSLCT